MSVDGACLLAFICPVPLSTRADQDHLQNEAARLAKAYRACSSSCAVANCVYSPGLAGVCNSSTHLCRGR